MNDLAPARPSAFAALPREAKLRRLAELLAAPAPWPLTPLQEAFLVGRADGGGGCHFYLELCLHDLDIDRLKRAWQAVCARHPMLRATVGPDGLQEIRPDPLPDQWQLHELSAAGPVQLAEHLATLRAGLAPQSFAPGDWPLHDICITCAPHGWSVVHLRMDEWIADAASLRLLLAEWRAAYLGHALPPPPGMTFQAYGEAVRCLRSSARHAGSLAYWLGKLDPLPPPPVLPRAAAGTRRRRIARSFDAGAWAGLQAACAAAAVTPTALLLALLAEVLGADQARQLGILITLGSRQPLHADIDRVVGPFTSTALVVAGWDGSLAERARLCQHMLWQDGDHALVDAIEVFRALRAAGRLPAGSVYPVVFTSLLGLPPEPDDGWLGQVTHLVSQTPGVQLDCQLLLQEGRLHVQWDVDAAVAAEELLATFARAVQDASGSAPAPLLAPVPLLALAEADQAAEFPLTEVQLAYLGARGSGGAEAAQAYQEFDVGGPDRSDLEAAWRQLVDTHPMLRAIVLPEGRQRILAAVPPYVIETGCDAAEIRRAMRARIFDPGRWPLFDIRISERAGGILRVHAAIDLLIADGPSIAFLFNEWFALAADPARRPRRPQVAFRDIRAAFDRYRLTPPAAEDLAWWQRRLVAAPRLLPPALVALAAQPGNRRTRREGHLAGWPALQATARRLGLTPEAVLLTAFTDVLEAGAAQAFTVVVVGWQRPGLHPDIDAVVGDFTDLAWFVRAAAGGVFIDRARAAQQSLEADRRHAAVSGLAALRKLPDVAGPQVVFSSPLPAPAADRPGVTAGFAASQTPGVLLDAIHAEAAAEAGGGLRFYWDCLDDEPSAPALDALFDAYGAALERLAANPAWDPGSAGPCLHQWIDAQVARTPQAIAVQDETATLTYAELNHRANRVAGALRRSGIGPDMPVGVMLPRSAALVVALLAVLKSGGAYLPIDPDDPPERRRFLLGDAGARALLQQQAEPPDAAIGQGDPAIPCISLQTLGDDPPDAPPLADLPCRTGSSDLAYIIYTSGSSGAPKGCMVAHAAICNRLGWMQDAYPIGPADKVLLKTPFTFDVSVWEVFWPLISGARIVVARPGGQRDAAYLAGLIAAAGVTTCHFVPPMLSLFLDEPGAASCASLRQVFTSGEALPYPVMDRCLALLPARLVNLYGPTEAAVDVTHWPCERRCDRQVPIGRPIANTSIHLLDPQRHEVPAGEVGEICIGGRNVGRGYVNRPELTAESFIADPFAPGGRLYCTGDLGRLLDDGTIAYLGRRDGQLKLRGHRIEPGEIEAALRAHPDVKAAVVVLREPDSPDPRLVAYCTPLPGRSLDPDTLRRHLQALLPAYMVPNRFAVLGALPLTRHGKTDRAALPWPLETGAPAAAEPSSVAAELAAWLAAALRVAAVDTQRDVFDLGATSFTLVGLVRHISRIWRVDVPLALFLQNPTLRAIAAHVTAGLAAPEPATAGAEAGPAPAGAEAAAVGFFSPEARAALRARRLNLRHDLDGVARLPLQAGPIDPVELQLRASCRSFAPGPVAFDRFAGLLSLLRQGGPATEPNYRYPSGGSLYAVQLYAYVKPDGVAGLAGGAYYYHPVEDALYRLSDATLGPQHQFYYNRAAFEAAAFELFFVVPRDAVAPVYGPAALHLATLEAGYIGQLLQSHQSRYGLGLLPIGAVDEARVKPLFRLAEAHVVLHAMLGGACTYPTAAADGPGANGDIAITGLAGRYPGAPDLDRFWENLRSGRRSISELPAQRWDGAQGFDPDRSRRRIYTRWGGFLDGIDRFDHALFGIAPAEARAMDPQERLFLETAWECLANAGYCAAGLREAAPRTGVFVGAMWHDHQAVGRDDWANTGQARAYAMHSAIANRVSHVFDLRGPSIGIDTSCASALTALHLACESLRRGECDAALVGGVNLLHHPYHLALLCGMGLLAGGMRSHALGAEADGWVPGEGVGAVLIRPLAAAQAGGDHVHAVVKGSWAGHWGRGRGFGEPNIAAQAEAVRSALAGAGVTPASIDYIETAATGAAMADAAELAALAEVFGDAGGAPCLFGSVKPNIGHGEAASGMAQLTKVLLQLRHGEIAPSLDCEPLNPLIQLGGTRLAVAREASAWPARDRAAGPARSLINAYGATGSCVHIVLERHAAAPARPAAGGPHLLVLSAASEAQLAGLADRLATWLDGVPPDTGVVSLADIAFTLATGREPWRHRLAVLAASPAEAARQLRHGAAGPAEGLWRGVVADAPPAPPLPAAGPESLAAAWVAGAPIDWAQHLPAGANRVPLPSMPLASIPHRLEPAGAVAPAPAPDALPVALPGDLEAALVRWLAEEAELGVGTVRAGEALDRYGLGSWLVARLNARMAREGLTGLPASVFYQGNSLREVARHIALHHADAVASWQGVRAAPPGVPAATGRHARPATTAAPDQDPIAIVGLAGRYPQAADLDALWDILRDGRDVITEIPAQRWEYAAWFDPRRHQPGRSYARWGGFLDDVDRFDPLFFGILPRDADGLDPQERLFLQCAWHAIEDAGLTRRALRRRFDGKVGVFAGVMYGEYQLFGARPGAAPVGLAYGSIANRVSYVLDLAGPSMAVDTLCSSSLVALHLACQSIRHGECRAAIAGGVNLSLHPAKFVLHAQAQMAAGDGRCRSFGAGGDGFAPAEAVGAAVLMRAADAQAGGHTIHALIRGSAVRHGGRTSGYTVPSPSAQADLIGEALDHAGLAAADISYVEAHGTGTALGDPIEAAGLMQAFAGVAEASCALGSIKSNIGHAEAAAGIAAVSKVVLQLRHRQLAPTLHATTPNPGIAFAGSPLRLQQALAPWHADAAPRRAGVSSFGAGGTIAHLVLEEAPAPRTKDAPGAQLLILSARTADQLRQQAANLAAYFARDNVPPLADIAHTLRVGRDVMAHRLALIAITSAQAATALAGFATHGQADGVMLGESNAAASGLDPADAQTLARGWLASGALAKLAGFWLSGGPVAWDELMPGDGRCLVGLPGYPFERRRCWLTEPPEASEAPVALLCQPVWEPAPAAPGSAPAGPVLILDRDDRLVRHWRGRDVPVIHAVPGHGFGRLDDDSVRLDPADPAQWLQLIWDLHGRQRLPGAAIICESGFLPLFGLSRALIAARTQQAALLSLHRPDEPEFAAAAAFMRSLRREQPGLRGKAVQVDAATPFPALADLLAAELAPVSLDAAAVRYDRGSRETTRLRPHTACGAPADLAAADGVCLVTGGAGGIGLALAAHLLQAGRRHLVLVGRSALDGSRARRLQMLGGPDRVTYLRADVTDAAATLALIQTVRQRLGRISFVIHAAGALRDGLLPAKTAADLAAVLDPKIDGARHLDAALADAPLDRFVLFSSLAAATGNAGQCDYAYANGFLDGFAAWREGLRARGERHGRTLSIAWPLWAEGGMRLEPAAVAQLAEAAGILPLPTAAAIRLWPDLLAAGPCCAVLYGHAGRLRAALAAEAPSPAPPTGEAEPHSLLGRLRRVLSEETAIAEAELDAGAPFAQYGLDSLAIGRVTRRIEAEFGQVAPTLLLEHPNLRELAHALAGRDVAAPLPPTAPATAGAEPQPADRHDHVAIVGMAGRFPAAASPDALWHLLAAGESGIGPVPPERWDPASFAGTCRTGGFLDDVAGFDAEFFHLTPAEAALMHPEERLLLHCAWAAVEDAGCGFEGLRAGRTGLFVGVTSLLYPLLGLANPSLPPDSSAYTLANRLSHQFDWSGPSLAVDTACSASLVALHLAAESIRSGDCTAAMAAGANLYLHPAKYCRMSQNRMLAGEPLGLWDRAGEGFTPGEGVAAMLLMPLGRAQAEALPVHGVIEASRLSHTGRTTRFLAPSAAAQETLIRRTLQQAGIGPAEIGYVELHAPGTALGDGSEWDALAAVFGPARQGRPVPVGSLKANIGHLEAASGIAQLTKILLQFRHAALLPNRVAAALRDGVAARQNVLRPQRVLAAWDRSAGPRRALLSSAGAGGAQACIVVAAPPDRPEPALPRSAPSAMLFPLSARTEAQLREVAAGLRAALADETLPLAGVAATLQTGRVAQRHRLAIVAADRAALNAALDDAAGGRVPAGGQAGFVARPHEPLAVDPGSVEAAWRARDLDGLARLWVDNVALDWTRLDADRSARVHLPTYPFTPRRCWLDAASGPAVPPESIAAYYDRFAAGATGTEAGTGMGTGTEPHLVFAPLRAKVPGLSWLATLVEPARHPDHHRLVSAAQREMKALLLRRIGPGAAVLDIGCGLGTDLITLARRDSGLSGHGYTISGGQAEACRERIAQAGLAGRLQVWQRDSAMAPFPGQYDAVLAFEVITHIADKPALFANIARHLRPGGRVLLADVVAETKADVVSPLLGHHTATTESLAFLLAAQGLAVDWAADATVPIGHFLDDAAFEANLAALSARHAAMRGAEAAHRGWHRLGEAMRCGLFRYLLLDIVAVPGAEAAANRRAMQHAMPYAEAVGAAGPPDPMMAGLRDIVAGLVGQPESALDETQPFAEMGLNSLQGLLLIEQVNAAFGLRLAAAALYDAPCIAELAAAVAAARPVSALPETAAPATEVPVSKAPVSKAPVSMVGMAAAAPGDIAVIGLAARFAGAVDAASLWQNLRDGVDAVAAPPPDRPGVGGRALGATARGGFIADIDAFDPLFFGIAPAEAEMMDPQQRLFLQACWHALEDAGRAGAEVSGTDCGVIAGVAGSEYARLIDPVAHAAQAAQAMLGNDHAILAARIAYHLNLKGPALAVNTACSSSLVAVHLACEILRRGEAGMMLAGGVSLTLDPDSLAVMNQAGMLSPGGRCRPFGAGADGIAIGEGVGVVVLKPLAQALADGHHIHGVIKASGMNQDGRTNGITAPSGAAQASLIRAVHRRFAIAPDSIGCVEAHGTGTRLGDPIEAAALTEAFRAGTSRTGFCALGSIKGNIGHTGAASGIAGLIKLLLALAHRELPPTLHAEPAAAEIDFANSPFVLNHRLRPWEIRSEIGSESGPAPRRAAVSAFGFSGTNCHVVIEEAPARPAPDRPDGAVLIPLSGRTPAALVALAEALAGQLDADQALADIAFTWQLGRRALPYRLALVVDRPAEAAAALAAFLRNEPAAGLYAGEAVDRLPPATETGLPALAAAWVRGHQVDWARLHLGAPRRRVRLPGYPFARDRFWAGLRPGDRAGATSRLSGTEFFLAGHKVRGRPTLPAVLTLELARAAAGAPALRGFAAVTWLRPVQVESGPVELSVTVAPDAAEPGFRLTVQGALAAEGRLLPGEPAGQKPPVDLPAIRNRAVHVLDGEECYRRFAACGLDYGPGMRALQRLHCGAGEALAELLPVPEAAGMQLHPAILDAAFQAILGVSGTAEADQLRLPFSLARLELCGEVAAARFAHVRAAGGSFDIDLLDAACRPVAQLRELLLRPAPAAPAEAPHGRVPAGSLEALLRAVFARVLKLPPAELRPDVPFDAWGIDSIQVTRLTRELEPALGPLPMTLLFEAQTLAQLSARLRERHADAVARLSPALPVPAILPGRAAPIAELQGGEAPVAEVPIAIIGMSGRFPGAPTLDGFWDNLLAGRDCITEIPPERWEVARWFDPDRDRLGRAYTKWGGFIDAASFDPLFFGIAPSDAALIDPQERLFLETAWAAMEDAGAPPARLGRQVGVFVGVMYGEYQFLGVEDLQAGGRVALNSSYASVANRLSWCCDFQGPSIALDTMCSSSLTAIHLAAEALRRGDCLAAIAGGVNLSVHPNKYLQISQGRFASSDGRCRSFGAGGDGYVPGEGVAAVVLKTLPAAQAAGDRILAVIRGSALNHNGHTRGYTVPDPRAQAAVIRTALQRAGVAPASIGYVEAHGTGTALGDPVEIAALSEAYGRTGGSCAIGSVKSNIGHAEAAAGIAGLIKVVQQLRHRTLAPSLHADAVNPHIDFAATPFRLQRVAASWSPQAGAARLRAGLSSFGAGGANAHLIIEESLTPPPAPDNAPEQLVVLSAKDAAALRRAAANLCDRIGGAPGLALVDIAHTLQVGREAMAERLAVRATDTAGLAATLRQWLDGACPSRLWQGRARPDASPPVRASLADAAAAWVSGAAGTVLPGAAGGRIVSLPSYPFARERYWFTPSVPAPSVPDSAVPARVGHLLGANVSTLDGVRFAVELSGADPLIRDHRVAGHLLVPGAMIIEMARQAGGQAAGRQVTGLRKLAWITPVDVTGGPCSLEWRLRRAGPDAADAELVAPAYGAGAEVLHAQVQLLLDPVAPPAAVDVAALRQRCETCVEAADCYAALLAAGLDYGPGLRVIRQLHRGDGEVLAVLGRPARHPQLPLDPALLDGAFQALIALAQAGPGEAAPVPFALREMRLYRPLPQPCLAHLTLEEPASGHRRCAIRLLSETGEVAATLSGLASRALPSAASPAGLITRHYQTVWSAMEPTPPAPATGGDLVIAAGDAVWRAFGDAAILVQPGAGFARTGPLQYRLDPSRMSDWTELLDALDAEGGLPARIHYLLPLAEAGRAWGHATLADGLASGFAGLLALVRALLPRPGRALLRLLSVYAAAPGAAHFAALGGFFRSLALEDPLLRGTALGVDPDTTPAALAAILRAAAAAAEPELRRAGAQLLAPRLRPAASAPDWPRLRLRNRGRYLITGGLGGLGLIVAGWLARQYRARLLLTGRRPADAAVLAGLGAFAAELTYVAADAAVPAEAARLRRAAQDAFGGIDGIFHAAGHLQDGLLRTKELADAELVWRPKILGAAALDLAFADQKLDAFVLFSSLAGSFGNAGQADYAFANAWLDHFAVLRETWREAGLRQGATIAMGWPLWAAGGMAVDAQMQDWLRRRHGLAPLPTSDGLLALATALSGKSASVLVIHGEAEALARLTGTGTPASALHAAPPVSPGENLCEVAEALLTRHLRAELQLGERPLDLATRFEVYGLDSVRAVRLTRALETVFGDLPMTLFYEYPSVAELAGYLQTAHAATLASLVSPAAAPEPPAAAPPDPGAAPFAPATPTDATPADAIAIIGIAGRFPQADDLFEFWDNLAQGRDCITERPTGRRDADRFHDAGARLGGRGGFLRDVAGFDPLFFGISPREAALMDPQERLFLQTAWHAFEDAGLTRARLPREVGVYVGVMWGDYQLLGGAAEADGLAPGACFASIANRVSFFFDFAGPSLALDTMCSSSLTALHLACEALRSGEIAMALAGGVNLSLHPQKYRALGQGGFLSSDGRCRSFGAGGDGYVPGEGVGAAVLMPLARALAEGHPVQAVIRGSAVNHGGRATGYTVPNPNAQAAVIRRVLERAGVAPETVTCIEAHGTGTALGDPIEIAGLARAFPAGARAAPCAIGSVKSNIGHLEAAAGIAGVAKVVLQLRHARLAPTLHAETINPAIRFTGTRFVLQRSLADWPSAAAPRRAGISAFGAGGANAHLLLEAPAPAPACLPTEGVLPFVVSARTEASLAQALTRLAACLGADGGLLPQDVAYTLAVGREAMACRVAILADGLAALAALLQRAASGQADAAILRSAGAGRQAEAGIAVQTRGEPASDQPLAAAERWIAGGAVDWPALPTLQDGRIVSLPGYAFATDRYWITADDKPSGDAAIEVLRRLAAGTITLEQADQAIAASESNAASAASEINAASAASEINAASAASEINA